MHCEMFLCFSSILPRELHSVWKQFLSEFISLCFEISEIVSPVVHNSSPEGNIPLDALKGKKITAFSFQKEFTFMMNLHLIELCHEKTCLCHMHTTKVQMSDQRLFCSLPR